jgi:putative LysE/RhtB family amino acid efflux pump
MNTTYILSAILLGIVVAIPPGSVTIVACQKALKNGFHDSLMFTIGSSISDVFYITLTYYGVAKVLSENETYKIALWIICGIILNYIGVKGILDAVKMKDSLEEVKPSCARHESIIEGILITLTNPLTIVGWIAVAGNFFLLWSTKTTISFYGFVFTVFLIMFGCLSYFISLIFIVSKAKHFISISVQRGLLMVSAVLLNIFGVIALVSAIRKII